jgi:WD40 repeat protein/transcriptional regulator with XRE-family HTH domain
LRHRGRTGLIQRELAVRAGVSLRSVQEWEAGDKFPTAERLQALVEVLLDAGGFTKGREEDEARELWTAAERDAPRMHTPFDEEWFAGLLATRESQSPMRAAEARTGRAERARDWGEAPDTTGFVGRVEDLDLLQHWVLVERCRLVALLGIGGIGKTSLAARLAQTVAHRFERVYWRSLRNAPPVGEWLAGAIGFLSDQQLVAPAAESEQVRALVQLLRTGRNLLVLDNAETLFEPGQRESSYRQGMEGYGRLLQVVGETSHQSCVLLTSREAPPELLVLGDGVRSLELHGLRSEEAQDMLADKQLFGDSQAWLSLVERYGGNGLALRIVGDAIRQIYDGDLAAFLNDAIATYGTVFGGIRRLLDDQVARLSPVEYEVLTRFAIEREPISLAELARDLAPSVRNTRIVEAIETLRRRSLVERGEREASFTLQSMVLEYVTDRIVETVAEEIRGGPPFVLIEHPLIKAQAKEYVRQTQERLIGAPILQGLTPQRDQTALDEPMLALLGGWRDRPTAEQGYGPGNVINLLRVSRGDLRGLDLSHLAIRQAYLAQVDAQDATLAESHLVESVFAEAFVFPTSVALSADGMHLGVGTSTGQVHFWRLADRMPLWRAQGPAGMVWGLAISDKGGFVASGGADGSVRLWEARSGVPQATLRGHESAVWCVALSADGRLLASGDSDGIIRLWGPDNAGSAAVLQGHTGVVRGVSLSADGRLLASGGEDGTVRLWSLTRVAERGGSTGMQAETVAGQPLATLRGHTGPVWAVALSPDGRLLTSSGEDGTVRLWTTRDGQLAATLQAHTGIVWRVAFSDDGRLLASCGGDGMVRLWEPDTGRPLGALQGHRGTIVCVALSASGEIVASGGTDGAVRSWTTSTGRLVTVLQGIADAIVSVALSADGRVVASGGADGTLRLWETGTGRLLGTMRAHEGAAYGIALSASGHLLASGGGDGTVKVWETATWKPLESLRGHTGGVWSVALSAHGEVLASGGGDGTIRLWEPCTGQPLAMLHGHSGTVREVALSPDGELLASGGGDGTAGLWSTSTADRLATLQGDRVTMWKVALASDAGVLVSGGSDGTVRLWSVRTGEPLAVLQGGSGEVWSVALSADGQLVVAGFDTGIIKLWAAGTREELATLVGHTGAVWGVALSTDGHLLASGGGDGTVRLWQPTTGECLRTLRAERRYERLNITGLTGVTETQRAALLALGAVEQAGEA